MNTKDLKECANPYRSAHDHVRQERGRADSYECAEEGCGLSGFDWALKAEEDLVAEAFPVRRPDRPGKVFWVSPLPTDYESKCRRHHRQADALRRREALA